MQAADEPNVLVRSKLKKVTLNRVVRILVKDIGEVRNCTISKSNTIEGKDHAVFKQTTFAGTSRFVLFDGAKCTACTFMKERPLDSVTLSGYAVIKGCDFEGYARRDFEVRDNAVIENCTLNGDPFSLSASPCVEW